METQVWTSLLGVALGGGFTYVAQLTAARQSSRTEACRTASQLAEARRTERLELLREFIRLTQQGIRLAQQRESAADWEAAATPEWHAAASALVDELWMCERMISVIFPSAFYRWAWDYGTAVDQVLWREYDHVDVTMHDHLERPQIAFLEAAHAQIAGAVPVPQQG